jgi:hypothetical protein
MCKKEIKNFDGRSKLSRGDEQKIQGFGEWVKTWAPTFYKWGGQFLALGLRQSLKNVFIITT